MTTITSPATTPRQQRVGLLAGRRDIPWLTAIPLAALLAYADGFVVTSLTGAIGAIERTSAPFESWLRGSTSMVPVYLVAVLGALALARRRYGSALHGTKAVVATALVVVAACTLVAIGTLVVSSAYDYHLQSNLIRASQVTHTGPNTMPGMAMGGAAAGTDGMAMGGVAAQQHATLMVHLRGGAYASVGFLVVNLVVVAWFVAMRGGSWPPRRGPRGDAVPAA